ncbi:cupin domain-containing protein [Pseudomonas brassicacearum]|uniref:Cupin n=1 Tax=Pseudomonas brassicacearum TaxID=930166 RepID=A0A423GPE5_9PSED|nr:cupin domain-containing protein [Pseudomonas brassicacearum]ROM94539.1 cupin [Pseudomonas brassicacearum]
MNKYLSISILVGTMMAAHPTMATDTAPAAKETETLQRIAVNGTNRELGMGISEFPPNAEKPRHRAIGPEIVYVIQGEIIVLIDGQLAKTVRAGESYQLAAKDVHTTKAGPSGAKTIASWVTIPGKQFNIYTNKE